MSPLGLVLLILLILLLVGGLPSWPHQAWGYGYWPSGSLGLVLVIVLILVLIGRI